MFLGSFTVYCHCKNYFQEASLMISWYPLAMFGICFGLIITAFIFLLSAIFGGNLHGYQNILVATAAIISLPLGKVRYHQLESSSQVLGPILFFEFSIIINWVMVNILVSILTDLFVEILHQVLARGNDYEVVDYVLNSLKDKKFHN